VQLHVEVQNMTTSPPIFATLVLSCAMLKTLVLDLGTVIVPCLDFVADMPRRSDFVQLRQPHEDAATKNIHPLGCQASTLWVAKNICSLWDVKIICCQKGLRFTNRATKQTLQLWTNYPVTVT